MYPAKIPQTRKTYGCRNTYRAPRQPAAQLHAPDTWSHTPPSNKTSEYADFLTPVFVDFYLVAFHCNMINFNTFETQSADLFRNDSGKKPEKTGKNGIF